MKFLFLLTIINCKVFYLEKISNIQDNKYCLASFKIYNEIYKNKQSNTRLDSREFSEIEKKNTLLKLKKINLNCFPEDIPLELDIKQKFFQQRESITEFLSLALFMSTLCVFPYTLVNETEIRMNISLGNKIRYNKTKSVRYNSYYGLSLIFLIHFFEESEMEKLIIRDTIYSLIQNYEDLEKSKL